MDYQQLVDIIEDAGYEADSYSGRCMYGAECVSIFTDDSEFEVATMMAAAAQRLGCFDEWTEVACRTKRDLMGLGIVLYWPSVAWPEEATEEEAEEQD